MTASSSTDDRVLFDVDSEKRIATITLNNPGQRNSYDATMRDAVAGYLERVAEDDDITVVLLRGADGVFSTGADMNNAYGWYGDQRSREEQKTTERGEKPAKSRPSQRRRLTVDRKSFGFYHNLMGFPKVTVGEISGYALGGGFEMALMTDISVIGRDTKIGMPATRFLGPALGRPHETGTASVEGSRDRRGRAGWRHAHRGASRQVPGAPARRPASYLPGRLHGRP